MNFLRSLFGKKASTTPTGKTTPPPDKEAAAAAETGVSERAFYNAIVRHPLDMALIRDLIAKGANIESVSERNATPLSIAVDDRELELARLLIESGANVNPSQGSRSPLDIAALNRQVDLAALLLDHGAFVTVRDERRSTPLLKAALSGSVEIVELLIAHGADVNAADKYGYTALHESARSGKADVVALLLSHGANARAMVGSEMPLEMAKKGGHTEVMALLTNADPEAAAMRTAKEMADTTELTRAIKAKDLTEIKNLIDSGADVNALHKGSPAIVQAVNVGGDDALKIVEWLVQKGVRLNAADELGRTALDFAASDVNIHLVRLLLEKGAAVNPLNGLGMTPMQGAKMQGHSEIVYLFQMYGGH